MATDLTDWELDLVECHARDACALMDSAAQALRCAAIMMRNYRPPYEVRAVNELQAALRCLHAGQRVLDRGPFRSGNEVLETFGAARARGGTGSD